MSGPAAATQGSQGDVESPRRVSQGPHPELQNRSQSSLFSSACGHGNWKVLEGAYVSSPVLDLDGHLKEPAI